MFRNEPLIDFTVPANRAAFQDALATLDKSIAAGMVAHPIVEGKTVSGGERAERRDPSNTAVVIGKVDYATEDDARRALECLDRNRDEWERVGDEKRSAIIARVGSIMRERKLALAALIVRETGKPWREADGDVAEAIDFCDYYAYQMREMSRPRLTMEVPGEESFYLYQPRGVAVVIAPWNFPLAIACGMAVAALVCGNTTVLKPAEQSSLIAFALAQIILEAGVPPSAFAFLPGRGETVGKALVESPLVDVICFTGSKSVGLEIIASAAKTRPGQRNVKKVIAEMGGKNAIIVDDDADLDEAVKGILQSAFGYSGQKCSACSRLIVVGDAYEPLLSRLGDAARDALVGPAFEAATFMGPVIDDESQKRILGTIAKAEQKTKILTKGAAPESGHYVPITIFRDVEVTNDLWLNEIFGPVLACRRAESFEDAVREANLSEYALTGGVFSRSPSHLDYARRNFKVGNLYLNRGCTGALVCRHPFGGFKMSGVGSKAGGPDYLLQFLEPRTITENTMRRGFAPQKNG